MEEEQPTSAAIEQRKTSNSGVTEYISTTTQELKQALFQRRRSIAGDEFFPELVLGRSEILDYDDVKNIEKELPNKTGPWNLNFSTSLDGFSLQNLYQKMEGIEGPILIVIKDISKRIFGAVLSDPLRFSETYYGTGESMLLFRCRPNFEAFHWTKANDSFIKGDPDSFSIGDGTGCAQKCGLHIEHNLKHGRTSSCSTFGNPPLVSDNDGRFMVKSLECWYFSYI